MQYSLRVIYAFVLFLAKLHLQKFMLQSFGFINQKVTALSGNLVKIFGLGGGQLQKFPANLGANVNVHCDICNTMEDSVIAFML